VCAPVVTVTAGAGVNRGDASDTLVFGTTSDVGFLDGALAPDSESVRAISQIVETLVTLKPGTTKVVGLLATGWKQQRKAWTFTLRKGVVFSDGTPFNAAAVCFNFNRWYNFAGPFQSPGASFYWRTIFGGFAHNESSNLSLSLYRGCKTLGKYKVVIELTRPYPPLLPALTLSAFSIASPTALRKFGADLGEVSGGTFRPTGTYAFRHPTGTGPYTLKSWQIGQKLELVANPRYRGGKPKIRRIIFRPIPNSSARLQALQTGEIQGMDYVAPQDISTVRSNARFKVLTRPPFNLGYVTINSGIAPTNNLLVRKAIAYALDKRGVVNAFYGGLGTVAQEFQTSSVPGYAKDVQKYRYDPEKSKSLLRQAGLTLPVSLDFYYPTNVTRAYMPNSKGIFQAFSASLEKSGFRIVPHSAPWQPDYIQLVRSGKAGNLNLLGWNGILADADNWMGAFFKRYTPEWGFQDNYLFNLIQRASMVRDPARRAQMYKTANKYIMGKLLPGIPYAHSKSAIALTKNIKGFIASPAQLEFFRLVYYG
jgi:peptide/nickel transport system substrate-binding protein